MCIGCRKRKKKKELMRLTRGEGTFILDRTTLLAGRGYYLCPDANCLRMAQKKNRVRWTLGSAGSATPTEQWNNS
jgi:hypothetical protein